MFIARIDGSITSTVKHKSLQGMRLLIGQRLEADGSEVGEPLVLADDLGGASVPTYWSRPTASWPGRNWGITPRPHACSWSASSIKWAVRGLWDPNGKVFDNEV